MCVAVDNRVTMPYDFFPKCGENELIGSYLLHYNNFDFPRFGHGNG